MVIGNNIFKELLAKVAESSCLLHALDFRTQFPAHVERDDTGNDNDQSSVARDLYCAEGKIVEKFYGETGNETECVELGTGNGVDIENGPWRSLGVIEPTVVVKAKMERMLLFRKMTE